MMNERKNIVICLVGLNGSGKGNVCRILERVHGFRSVSTSDVIRSIAKERDLEPTREHMGMIGNEVRAKYGKDYLTSYLSESMNVDLYSYVVDGCRQIEEIEFLQKKYPGKVHVIRVYCDPKIRYERMKARNRVGDPATYEEFLFADEIELGNVDAVNRMNYRACFEISELQVDNNSSIEVLEKNVKDMLEIIYSK